MEVHHQAHTPRKKWTHYFWEFLMLFLAVFCGFLAENLREHYIEHKREKQYIRSLIKDVELDIASLQNSYELRKVQISYFDSLTGLLQHGYENQLKDFYFYARHITRRIAFRYHDRTIQQLKNSGNLRLIRDNDASDSLTIYDNEVIKFLLMQQDAEDGVRMHIGRNLAGKIFDGFIWNETADKKMVIIKPVSNPSLTTRDPALLSEFEFAIVTLKGTLTLTNRIVEQAIQSARNLVEIYKKAYHIK